MSLSFDGPTAELHDAFRGVEGAFERSLKGLGYAQEAGISIQINTTVTRLNVDHLAAMLEFAVAHGAGTLDLFFLVPTGRGAALSDLALSAQESERALQWVARAAREAPIRVKTTCAPQFARIAGPQGGCMAGRGFLFISHRGVLQPCGFLDIPCGDLREQDFDIKGIYRDSSVFQTLRDLGRYEGACGICDYADRCGGCRARAYAATGNFMAEEPTCPYHPQAHD
jgi:radical SAM protein with 4Fe4S-binding SPASM domain